jgi:hypothetical protein
VSQFTQLANPALTQRFTFALEDLTAVMGKTLLPVLEFATRQTRGFADIVQALSAPFSRLLSAGLKPFADLIPELTNTLGGPLVAILGQFADTVGRLVAPFASLTATFIKFSAAPFELGMASAAAAFEALAVPIEVAALLLSEFAKVIDEFVTSNLGSMRALLGIPVRKIAGGSEGAAVRSASFTGVEDYQKKVFAQAFALGSGSSSPETRTANAADSIVAWLKSEGKLIGDDIKAFLSLPANVAAALWNILKNHPAFKVAEDLGSGDVGRVAGALGPVAAVTGLPAAAVVLEGGRRLDEERKKATDDPVGYLSGLFGRRR